MKNFKHIFSSDGIETAETRGVPLSYKGQLKVLHTLACEHKTVFEGENICTTYVIENGQESVVEIIRMDNINKRNWL